MWNSRDPVNALHQFRTAANRALARRWYDEFINAHDVNARDDLLAPDLQSRFLGGSPGRGRDELKQIDGAMFATFPDLHLNVEVLAAGLYTSHATLAGDAPSVPGTGNAITGTGTGIFRAIDGKDRGAVGGDGLYGVDAPDRDSHDVAARLAGSSHSPTSQGAVPCNGTR